jgi:hypothetical protein
MNEFVTAISSISVIISIFLSNGRRLSKYLILFAVFFFILTDGLRWQMGTDWQSYFDNYNFIDDKFTPGFDIGFEYYTLLLKNLFDNYSFYLLTNSFLIFGILFYTFKKFGDNNFIGFLYTFCILIWYSGSMRQLIAVSLLCIAISYLIERKILLYFILVIIGSFFHFSLLFCLPFYFFYNRSFKFFSIFFILMFIIVFLLKGYIIYFENILSLLSPDKDFSNRLYGGLDTNIILGYGRKILLYLIFFIYIIKLKLLYNKRIVFLFSISSFSILLYHFAVNYSPIVASRLDIYTGVLFTAFLIAEISKHTKSKMQKMSLFIVVFFYIIINYSRLEFMDLFHPYSGIFYNVEFNRVLY